MIHHGKRVIFIHIGKAAGSSAERWLLGGQPNLSEADYDCGLGYCQKEGLWLQHATAETMKRLYPEYFNNYFKWTIVRNPYDRMKSVYRFGRYHLGWIKYGFDDFVRDLPRLRKLRHDCYGDPKKGYHYNSQYGHTHVDGTLVCHVVKFEELPNGLPQGYGEGEFPHSNKDSWTPDGVDVSYTDETREMIREIYQKDFEVFGYDF